MAGTSRPKSQPSSWSLLRILSPSELLSFLMFLASLAAVVGVSLRGAQLVPLAIVAVGFFASSGFLGYEVIFSSKRKDLVAAAARLARTAEADRHLTPDPLTPHPKLREFLQQTRELPSAIERTAPPEFSAIFEEALNEFVTHPRWRELAEGRILFDSRATTEWYLRMALSRTQQVVQNLTFCQPRNWSRDYRLRSSFLDETGQSVSQTEIFVGDTEDLTACRSDIVRIASRGVRCRIIDPQEYFGVLNDLSISPREFLSFALLDQSLLIATPESPHPSDRGYLSVDPYEVETYIRAFENLDSLAFSPEEYFELQAPPQLAPIVEVGHLGPSLLDNRKLQEIGAAEAPVGTGSLAAWTAKDYKIGDLPAVLYRCVDQSYMKIERYIDGVSINWSTEMPPRALKLLPLAKTATIGQFWTWDRESGELAIDELFSAIAEEEEEIIRSSIEGADELAVWRLSDDRAQLGLLMPEWRPTSVVEGVKASASGSLRGIFYKLLVDASSRLSLEELVSL